MNSFKQQFLPIILTIITFIGLAVLLYFFISLLNLFPIKDKILLTLRPTDMLVGLIIYLKTSVDFALFIGNQMKQNPGWKNRIAIEIGTALGNGVGTLIVLIIWNFFKEVPILMIVMILLAALILFRMAEDGLEEFQANNKQMTNKIIGLLDYSFIGLFIKFKFILKIINSPFSPFIGKILPHVRNSSVGKRSFLSLLLFAITIPFILGLDDFAGYIPLFSIVNVFGFAIGVFFGHMILNLLLFASPSFTVKTVKQPIIVILGSLAFVGIGVWGIYEAGQILLHFIYPR